ncbi:MAG: hypothetical protein AVDCRST_MAG22-746 [uncultured Rubrobacteraceae bacterium]|uniref:Gamma-glutamylcyclotransferase AIG2-like domain-containing protein n=1 Tax=uncultured Rubrobacteraceae bacterium TaxID=349277 RepID=A0A6J4NP14_9ACTN|nr:MAG: hypothetical protein AVDCRST_MAG22-746 [uncultured Rubrobacteraceae bacterium]
MDVPEHLAIQMFFYGTLKRGGRNHAYCRGGLMAAEARIRGMLYDLPQGYPAIVVPEETVMAVGTGDPLADALGANRLNRSEVPEPEMPAVYGELYNFDDPEERLPALDGLEAFSPDDPSSPYRRVLVPVLPDGGALTLAWAYAARHPRGTHLPGGRWPA